MDCNNTKTFSSNNKLHLDNQSLEGLSFNDFISFRSCLLICFRSQKRQKKKKLKPEKLIKLVVTS